MYFLRRITVKAFKCFADKTFSFDTITLVTGKIGSGKSTLIKDSLLFAIYGYSESPLANLVMKGKKECQVIVEIGDLVISRKFPTDISIKKAGIELTLSTNTLKQKYLDETFKDVEYFRKFRMIDVKQGINILEASKSTLVKTLIGFHQDFFNLKRQRLLELKNERETFNRDRLKLSPHYPSPARMKALNHHLRLLNGEEIEANKQSKEENTSLWQIHSKVSSLESNIDHIKKSQNNLSNIDICPTCLQTVPEQHKSDIINDLDWQLTSEETILKTVTAERTAKQNKIQETEKYKQEISNKKQRITRLTTILQERMKQSQFKYTEKDVIIYKKAIAELDSFCAKYITDWVKVLEPIINDIIKKIGFEVKFLVDNKNGIDIKLMRSSQEYSYKELSTGQRLILSIAFQLAMLLEKGEAGFIVADEGFGNLDEPMLDFVFDLIEDLPFQLLSVVHRYTPKQAKGISIIDL